MLTWEQEQLMGVSAIIEKLKVRERSVFFSRSGWRLGRQCRLRCMVGLRCVCNKAILQL